MSRPSTVDRRRFLGASLLGLAGAGTACAGTSGAPDPAPARPPTPPEIEGPFYPVHAQQDRDFDLTRIEGRDDVALGRQVWVGGRVVDQDGTPVEGAVVDIWQANAAGRYRHPEDPSDAPLDAAFQGWAIVRSGAEGGFRFKTIVPGAYPASADWDRPPHIHFKVSKRGFVELVTQMYFPGEPLNEIDRLLLRKTPEERGAMIARRAEPGADGLEVLDYVIVLERV